MTQKRESRNLAGGFRDSFMGDIPELGIARLMKFGIIALCNN